MHEARSLDPDLTDLEGAMMGWWLLLLAIALGAYLVAALLRPDWF
jgi:K+-transporting ATPase KdpF subunit